MKDMGPLTPKAQLTVWLDIRQLEKMPEERGKVNEVRGCGRI